MDLSCTTLQANKLDPIHHHAIRIAMGAFRTSPIIDILSEAMEVPLKIRRMHLSIKFTAKISSTPQNPVFVNKHFSTERSYHHISDEENRAPIL